MTNEDFARENDRLSQHPSLTLDEAKAITTSWMGRIRRNLSGSGVIINSHAPVALMSGGGHGRLPEDIRTFVVGALDELTSDKDLWRARSNGTVISHMIPMLEVLAGADDGDWVNGNPIGEKAIEIGDRLSDLSDGGVHNQGWRWAADVLSNGQPLSDEAMGRLLGTVLAEIGQTDRDHARSCIGTLLNSIWPESYAGSRGVCENWRAALTFDGGSIVESIIGARARDGGLFLDFQFGRLGQASDDFCEFLSEDRMDRLLDQWPTVVGSIRGFDIRQERRVLRGVADEAGRSGPAPRHF